MYICMLLLSRFLFKRGTYGISLPLPESILLNLSCHSPGVAAPISVRPESGQCSMLCGWVPMPHQQWLSSAGFHEGPVTHVTWHRSSLGFARHWLSISLYFSKISMLFYLPLALLEILAWLLHELGRGPLHAKLMFHIDKEGWGANWVKKP